ncbi:MAG TPA: hypothetical protein V6D17_02400, partial [Candidatus Obscuribacterales bacterium]
RRSFSHRQSAALVGSLSLILNISLPAKAEATLLRGYLEEIAPCATQAPTEAPLPESFPATYIGRWRCVTTVTDSQVSSIIPGQQTISEIKFRKRSDGKVVADWSQPGWAEAEATAISFDSQKARVDRTNYYYGEGLKGAWAARSRDDFTRVGTDKMTAQSYVDQYLNGQYLGRYRTTSVLQRINETEGLAENLP